MKIIWDILGAHIELSGGFAWCFIGLVAFIELCFVTGVLWVLSVLI